MSNVNFEFATKTSWQSLIELKPVFDSGNKSFSENEPAN